MGLQKNVTHLQPSDFGQKEKGKLGKSYTLFSRGAEKSFNPIPEE